MRILGAQLSISQYQGFRQAIGEQLPHLVGRIQTVNAGGRCAVNGNLTDSEAGTIHGLYDTQRETAAVAGFDMLAYQGMERRRAQTHAARSMRTARAMRFAR